MTSPTNLESNILTIESFFNNTDAFVIPEYQRSYQWRENHIDKLFSDLISSIATLLDAPTIDAELRFLGTIITISDTPSRFGSIRPRMVRQVIDGQQRITTLMLMSIMIDIKLSVLLEKYRKISDDSNLLRILEQNINRYQIGLKGIYSFTISSLISAPALYPALLREESDKWDLNGSALVSPVVKLIAQHLKSADNITTDDKNLESVLSRIETLLENVSQNNFEKIKSNESFETYELKNFMHRMGRFVYLNDGGKLSERLMSAFSDDQDLVFSQITRISVLTYYMLSKCYVNHINTTSENSAFDMFIGLNTTGIPLSSVETFRAHALKEARGLNLQLGGLVREKINSIFSTGEYSIENYFDGVKSQERKDKRIKEYVTSFALYYSGEKVGYNPNQQREYLKKAFNKFTTSDDHNIKKEKQIQFLEHIHSFTKFQSALDENPPAILSENVLSPYNAERETALLAKNFLSDVDLTIVHPLWARMYGNFTKADSSQITETAKAFGEIVTATAAFYSLWRAVAGVNGLPEVYRSWMLDYFSVLKTENVDHIDIQNQMFAKLSSMKMSPYNFTDKAKWVEHASRELRMSSNADLCRFILLWTAHNTASDAQIPGLMQIAASGYQHYANHTNWKSVALKSIEHIAPKNPEENTKWDSEFYGSDNLYDSIGNLILLPLDLNTSLSNREWESKLYYYRYVVEETNDKRKNFVESQRESGVSLDIKTLTALQNAQYFSHVSPVVAFGTKTSAAWNPQIVHLRTKRILEIFHDRMISFLKK